MKRLTTIVLLPVFIFCYLLGISSPVFSQQPQKRKTERVHEIRQKYLSDKLHLTADQSRRFWPVYDQYEKELRDRRRQFNSSFTNRKNAFLSDEEARKYLAASLDLQEDIIRIKRKYNDQLLKIISGRQLANLNEAEKDFKKILIQQLKTK